MAASTIAERTRESRRPLTAGFTAVVTDWLGKDFVWAHHWSGAIPFCGRGLAAAIPRKPPQFDEIIVGRDAANVIGVERGTRLLPFGNFRDIEMTALTP